MRKLYEQMLLIWIYFAVCLQSGATCKPRSWSSIKGWSFLTITRIFQTHRSLVTLKAGCIWKRCLPLYKLVRTPGVVPVFFKAYSPTLQRKASHMHLHWCLLWFLWERNTDFNLTGAPPAELQLGFSGQNLYCCRWKWWEEHNFLSKIWMEEKNSFPAASWYWREIKQLAPSQIKRYSVLLSAIMQELCLGWDRNNLYQWLQMRLGDCPPLSH